MGADMPSRAGSVTSTKVSDGLYVVSGAYAPIYDFFETSPLFPGEPLVVPTRLRVMAGEPAQYPDRSQPDAYDQ
jgi:hypothetical protein